MTVYFIFFTICFFVFFGKIIGEFFKGIFSSRKKTTRKKVRYIELPTGIIIKQTLKENGVIKIG